MRLEFSLEQPKGGVAFVVPSTGSDPMVSAPACLLACLRSNSARAIGSQSNYFLTSWYEIFGELV